MTSEICEMKRFPAEVRVAPHCSEARLLRNCSHGIATWNAVSVFSSFDVIFIKLVQTDKRRK